MKWVFLLFTVALILFREKIHSVTVAEVKEVMDKAIAHSQKASAKKLVKRVFGRNTDSSDRIIHFRTRFQHLTTKFSQN